jgi:hypothetical protein
MSNSKNTATDILNNAEPLTLEEEFGCDPWDEENYGKHPASREPDPDRVVHGQRW